jgi:hypothetical protein
MFVHYNQFGHVEIADDKGSRDCASNIGTDSLKYHNPPENSINIVTLAQKLEEKRVTCCKY